MRMADSAAPGAAGLGGVGLGGVGLGGVGPGGAGLGGAGPSGVDPGRVGPGAVGPGGVEPGRASPGVDPGGVQPAETGWAPKAPPLTTPWTRDVSPENAHPEYPRPQLTRRRWCNLNGVWQFKAATATDPPPVGRDLDERILVPFP